MANDIITKKLNDRKEIPKCSPREIEREEKPERERERESQFE